MGRDGPGPGRCRWLEGPPAPHPLGFIALYINFDTGKSERKADGKATVAEIVKMLRSAPGLQVGIEGQKPIADNRGEEGRAKNRRVERVKK